MLQVIYFVCFREVAVFPSATLRQQFLWILFLFAVGKWKMLKCENRCTEMDIWKQKYRSEKKSNLPVSSASLIHDSALQLMGDCLQAR